MTMANSLGRTDPLQTLSFPQSVILGLLIILAVCWFAFLGRQLAWPMQPGYAASLFASVHPSRGIVAVVIGMASSVFAGSLFLGRVKPDAGLLLAACGLARLAAVAGPVGAMARPHDGTHFYRPLLLELIFLFILIFLCWYGQRLLSRIGLVRPWPRSTESITRYIVIACVQAVLTGVIISILARDDSVKQVMTSVFVAALLGTVVVQGAVPVSTSTPLWIGTLLSGLVQYTWAGIFKHPVTVSPLAYASLGVAGSIAGFWASHRWNIMVHTSDEDANSL